MLSLHVIRCWGRVKIGQIKPNQAKTRNPYLAGRDLFPQIVHRGVLSLHLGVKDIVQRVVLEAGAVPIAHHAAAESTHPGAHADTVPAGVVVAIVVVQFSMRNTSILLAAGMMTKR